MRDLLLLACLVVAASAAEPDLLKPCRMRDLECVRDTTQQFLEKTSRGVPGTRLRAVDPLLVPRLDYDVPKLNVTHHITNLNITGLKQLQISEFGMEAGRVSMSFNVSASAAGDIAVDYHLPSATKTVAGKFTSRFQFVAKTSYPYSMVKDESSVEHYVVGAETTEFQVFGEPKYELSKDFLDAANEDLEVVVRRNKILATQRLELELATLSQFVHVIVPALVHNIRAAAAMLPATAFFIQD